MAAGLASGVAAWLGAALLLAGPGGAATVEPWAQVVAGQAGQSGPPPTGQTAAPGTAFLAGQVVDQADGRGISGASVALQRVMGVGVGQARPVAEVVTDAQGRFFFANLPGGSYALRSAKNSYVSPTATTLSRAIEVGDGERVVDLRIRLSKLAALNGIIRDDVGDPVVGMWVWAVRHALVNGRRTFSRPVTAASDDRGMFRFGSLVPGEYVVCACGRDPIPFDGILLTTLAADPLSLLGVAARALTVGADAATLEPALRTYAPTFYPNSATIARATRVTLAPGEGRNAVDIDVTAVRSTRLSGTIVGAMGAVQASSFRLLPAGESDEAGFLSTLPPALVQPNGRFDFAGVPPGQYVLRVVHYPSDPAVGGAPSGAALAFLGARAASMSQASGRGLTNEPPLWAIEPISVGDTGAAGVSVALRRAPSVRGRVEFIGSAPPPAAAILGRAVVIPQPVTFDPAGLGSVGAPRPLNPDATFTIPGVVPGRYSLFVSGFPGWPTMKSTVIAGVDVTDLPIEIDAADVSDVVIIFSDVPLARITGTLAATANTVAQTTVLLFPSDRRYWRDPDVARRRFRAMPVSRKGAFDATGLPAGEYFVAVVRDDDANEWQETSRLETLSRTAQRVQLRDGETRTLEVKR